MPPGRDEALATQAADVRSKGLLWERIFAEIHDGSRRRELSFSVSTASSERSVAAVCPFGRALLAVGAVAVSLCVVSAVEAAFPSLHLRNVCDDQLHAPTNLTHAGDGSGRLFVCDQPGVIHVFQQGMLLPVPFLDLTAEVFAGSNLTFYSELGLLGLCFHPDYENPGTPGHRKFYVNYTAPSAHPTLNPVPVGGTAVAVTVIAEYQVSAGNPNVADPLSKRIVLTFAQPQTNHNGGQIEFGPDGLLYIASGDGGGSMDNQLGHTEGTATRPGPPNERTTGSLGNSQDRRNLLGKILRIDPLGTNGPGGSYGIPAGNPFVGQTQDFVNPDLDGPMRGEIFAYGLRNPWRFSFDANFGGAPRLICADVGQKDVEEIDLIVSGGNYGWRVREGTAAFDLPNAYLDAPAGVGLPALIDPIAQYTHPLASLLPVTPVVGTSITGGYVYRGQAIPGLQGKYLCADYAVNGIGGGNGILIGVEATGPGTFSAPVQVTTLNALPAGSRIYAFGQDEAGELYLATKTTSGVKALDGGKPAGTLWKIEPPGNAPLTFEADLDTTLYQESGTKSNGKGDYVFAGKTGSLADSKLRRALLRFDLSTLPPGLSLTGASVQLTTTKQVSQDIPFTLHRMTAAWGEGNSDAGEPGGNGIAAQPGDATWTRRVFNTTNWATPGGDFIATASATATVGNMLTQPKTTWSSAQLLNDVLGWIATPASNHGWMVRGGEGTDYTAQRFGSREYPIPADRPKLILTYPALPPPNPWHAWLTTHFPDSPTGTYLDPEGDPDADGIVNQIEYACGLSPLAADPPGANQLTLTSAPGSGGTRQHTLTFRRDTTATDLTYTLETSRNLTQWTPVARSAGGATTTGQSGAQVLSETTISGSLRLVRVRQTEPAPVRSSFFARLRVDRAP